LCSEIVIILVHGLIGCIGFYLIQEKAFSVINKRSMRMYYTTSWW